MKLDFFLEKKKCYFLKKKIRWTQLSDHSRSWPLHNVHNFILWEVTAIFYFFCRMKKSINWWIYTNRRVTYQSNPDFQSGTLTRFLLSTLLRKKNRTLWKMKWMICLEIRRDVRSGWGHWRWWRIQPGLACTVGKISVSLLPLMLDSLCRGSRVPTPSFPLLPCRRPPFHRRNLSSPPKLLFSRSLSLFRPFRLSEPFSLSPPTDPRTRMRPCRRCYSEGPGLETSRTSKILWNCSSYTPQVTPLPPFPTRHSRFRGPPPQVHRTLTRRKTKDVHFFPRIASSTEAEEARLCPKPRSLPRDCRRRGDLCWIMETLAESGR